MSDDLKQTIAKWAVNQGPWMVVTCAILYWLAQFAVPMGLDRIESGYSRVAAQNNEAMKEVVALQAERSKSLIDSFEREQTEGRKQTAELLNEIRYFSGLKPRPAGSEE